MNEVPIESMGLVLFVWFVLFVVFTGFGFFILHVFGLRYHDADKYLKSFWIGWAFVIIFLQIWHFFFSIDWKAGILIVALSSVGMIWSRRELWFFVKEKVPRNFIFCTILIILSIILSNRAILPPLDYDSGLYHLTSVRWNASYPIVPGLGNLHGRLAFNSSYFCYVALLEILKHKAHHFANGLLLLLLFTQIFLSISKLLKNNGTFKIYNIYMALWFFPATMRLFSPNVSSPSPDFPIFILGVLLSGKLLSILENLNYHKRNYDFDLFYLTVIAVIGVTIKLSFIALAVSSCMLAFAAYLFKFRKTNDNFQVFKKVILATAIALVPWMLRSVILSGYLVYPSTLCSFGVDWKIPYASVVNNANWIYSWARMPRVHWSKVLGSWDWLAPWTVGIFKNTEIVISLGVVIIGCVFIILKRIAGKANPKTRSLMYMFFLPPLLSVIYWFFMAPNPRFLGSSLWILAIGISALIIKDLAANTRKIFILYVCLCTVFVLSFYISGKKVFLKTLIKEKRVNNALGKLYFGNIIKSGAGDYGFYETPKEKMKTFKTSSGLMLYVPEKGDQCWDAPLPCTPYPRSTHRLRRKESMRYGFSVYPRDEQDPTVGMQR